MSCKCPITISTTKYGNVQVRCQRCLQCKIMRHSQMQSRMQLEFLTSTSAQFLTLTFKDAPEPPDWKHFSDYMKRLRAWNRRKKNQLTIRYFAVGEYGEKSGRFHYHAMIYNHIPYPKSGLQHIKQWPHGHAYIGTVTPSSISYTAQYTTKYPQAGDPKPMAHWSLKPGLGAVGMRYIAQYMCDNSIPLPENANCLQIDGKKLFLGKNMMEVFEEVFRENNRPFPKKHILTLMGDHKIALKLNMEDHRFQAQKAASELLREHERHSNEQI